MAAFGAKISLTATIKNIIKDYPEGTQILKELLQNGDDAKARYMTFLFDHRTHGTDTLATADESPDTSTRTLPMASWQGPALLVFDSAVFEPKDLVSIQSPTESKKKYDPTKTGKFGVGFNSVYHLTDVVTFVSGRYLNVMDPHQKYCYVKGDTGVQFNLTLPPETPLSPSVKGGIDGIQHTLDGFCPGFKWCPDHVPTGGGKEQSFVFDPKNMVGSKTGGYPGTILRLPLRTPVMAEQSEIKTGKSFTEGAMKGIFDNFRDEVVELLIFLRHVESITLLEWHDGEEQPRELLAAEVISPTVTLRKERQAINNFFKNHLEGGPEAEDPRQSYAKLMGDVQKKILKPPSIQTGFSLSLKLDGDTQKTRTERWLLTLQFADDTSDATQLAIDSITTYPLNTADLKLVPWAMICARIAVNSEPCDPVLGVPCA
jgi:sacsin